MLLLLLAVMVVPAYADEIWCSTDPIFLVNGEIVEVLTEFSPADVASQITEDNPAYVRLRVPRYAEAQLRSVSGDFPEVVEIVKRGFLPLMRITVRSPQLEGADAMRVIVNIPSYGLTIVRLAPPNRTIRIWAPLPGLDLAAEGLANVDWDTFEGPGD